MISEKIVIVDDDQRVHQSLKAVLFEYQLISFLDPQKGLDYLLGPNETKLAIVDICMRGLDGLELLEKLKKRKPEMAVMMITGQANKDVMVEALRCRANDFLEKPFDVNELRQRVKTVLKEQSLFDVAARDRKDHIQRIRCFIERNPTNASLQHLAQEMCLSAQYLGRLFASHDRHGFRAYKLKVRMEKAMELLRQTSLDISEIGFKLGYENPESFMRTFKKFVHQTPGEYRKDHHARGRKT